MEMMQVGDAADARPLAPLGILILGKHNARQFDRAQQPRGRRQSGHDQQEPGVDAEGFIQGRPLFANGDRATDTKSVLGDDHSCTKVRIEIKLGDCSLD